MGCCYEKEEARTKVMLTFKREELLYDIENLAHVEGDVMDEGAQHARHLTQDVGDEGNVDAATRVLNRAASECVEILYPYTKEAVGGDEMEFDDTLREPECYVMRLVVPAGFSKTTAHVLEHLVHDYLVFRALGYWLGIVNPEKGALWTARAEATVGDIRRALARRTGKVRRKLHPW